MIDRQTKTTASNTEAVTIAPKNCSWEHDILVSSLPQAPVAGTFTINADGSTFDSPYSLVGGDVHLLLDGVFDSIVITPSNVSAGTTLRVRYSGKE